MIEYDDGEFGGPHEQEEYFIGNRNSESARLAHTSTLHIKRAKRKKRKVWYLVHSKLSPSVYKVFIDVAIGQLDLGKEETNIKKVIRSLMNTGELGVVKNSDHAILGHLDYAIIHLPTHRLVLHSEHRAQILDYCVQRFIHEPDPVGACINFIENNFFGFGDEIRVRDQILKRIKLQPLDQTAKDVNQYYEVDSDHISRLFEEAELNEPQPGPSNEPVTRRHFNAKEPVYYPDKDLTKAAILDDYHDILYELLIGTMGVDEVVDENLRDRLFPELWRWLIPEEIDETGDELVHGFRIRRRSDARIILKTSESELIWHLAREKLSSIHTNDQISFFVHERYVGAAPNREFCDPFSTILLRGQQINFPKPPPTIGSSPMQYVQIDVIEMPACRFNGRDYTNILVIEDLYSHFLFVKALFGVPEPDQIVFERGGPIEVRHLVDVFGSFSVPEGFRSGSPQKALSIAINDIRSMFDVNISYLGLGTIVPFMAREEICKRAKQIGRENSWVEVLPSTVIALNQKPHKAFDRKFSAFEVIFKRRPWKNQNLPPWLLSSRDENLPKIESSEQESFEYILNEYLKKKRPILNESGELTDPGTGFLFKPNDYVYIKNPCYQEQVEVVAKEIRADNPRYFRAVVTRVELTNPDFPYRVRYWDNPKLDELPANSWPEPGARETRVHVYDIVASTPRLAYLRNMVYTKFNTLNEAPMSANPICLYQPKKAVKKKPVGNIQTINFNTHIQRSNPRLQPYNEPGPVWSLKPTDDVSTENVKIPKKKKSKKKSNSKKERSAEEEEQMKKIEEILKSTFKWKPVPGDELKNSPSTSKMFENNEHQPLRIESEVNSPRVNSTWLIPTKDKPGEPSLKDYVKSLVRKSLLGNYKSPKLLPYTKPVTTLQRSTPTMPGTIRIVMPRILSSQSPSKRTL